MNKANYGLDAIVLEFNLEKIFFVNPFLKKVWLEEMMVSAMPRSCFRAGFCNRTKKGFGFLKQLYRNSTVKVL